jgi:hypothetical protein
MRLTLLICMVAMTLLYVTFMVYRTGLERLRDKNRVLQEEVAGIAG